MMGMAMDFAGSTSTIIIYSQEAFVVYATAVTNPPELDEAEPEEKPPYSHIPKNILHEQRNPEVSKRQGLHLAMG